ncbi:MAG: hypothetical protein WCO03_02910, partial [bacterium]
MLWIDFVFYFLEEEMTAIKPVHVLETPEDALADINGALAARRDLALSLGVSKKPQQTAKDKRPVVFV